MTDASNPTKPRCPVYSLSGGRCERPEGHDGKHLRHFESGVVYEWSDEDTRRGMDRYGSRFD